MISKDWMTSEDAKMEYEVIEDDSGIDWDDPNLIKEVFDQTDTRVDKIVNKLEYLLFGNPMILFSKVFIVFFAIFIAGHIARWLM